LNILTIRDAGFERLVAAFYRQVPDDEVLAALYPAHHLGAPSGGCGTFLCIASATLPSRSGSEAIQGCASGMRLVNVSKCFI
jgi:truncated hemoglobin YjbI